MAKHTQVYTSNREILFRVNYTTRKLILWKVSVLKEKKVNRERGSNEGAAIYIGSWKLGWSKDLAHVLPVVGHPPVNRPPTPPTAEAPSSRCAVLTRPGWAPWAHRAGQAGTAGPRPRSRRRSRARIERPGPRGIRARPLPAAGSLGAASAAKARRRELRVKPRPALHLHQETHGGNWHEGETLFCLPVLACPSHSWPSFWIIRPPVYPSDFLALLQFHFLAYPEVTRILAIRPFE